MQDNDMISFIGFSDPVSSMTHLLAAGIFLVLTGFMLHRGRVRFNNVFWLSIFNIGILFMLSMSGVYHLLSPGTFAREEVLRRLDHAAIFFLIASTFTAAHGILFLGFWKWGVIIFLWLGTAAAITLKTVFFHDISYTLGLALYLGFGWVGVVSGILLYRAHGFSMVRHLLFGGIAYTAGALFEYVSWPVLIPRVLGPHELFHLAVIIGLWQHWKFVWSFAHFSVNRDMNNNDSAERRTG